MDSTTIAILGLCLSAAAFFFGRQSASRDAGREAGEVAANLKNIKEATDRIENNQREERIRTDGRFEAVDMRLDKVSEIATRAKDSASSAHKRLDGINAPSVHTPGAWED